MIKLLVILFITQNSFLHQCVSNKTHSWSIRRSTLIDLIFASDDQSVANLTYASPLGKSHHKILKFKYLIKRSLYLCSSYMCSLNSIKNHPSFLNWSQILDSCGTISCREMSPFQDTFLRKSQILVKEDRLGWTKTLFPN